MRKYLAKEDWYNMLRNKTAIECWNILKYEIESIIDRRVYKRTRKDEDYANYKEALNAATTEVRQSKGCYEQKLACNIKMTARVFMHMSGVSKTYEIRSDL